MNEHMNLVVRWIFCLFDKMVMAVTQWFVGLKMGEIYGIDITYGRCSLQQPPIERWTIESWFCDGKLSIQIVIFELSTCDRSQGAKSRQLEKKLRLHLQCLMKYLFGPHLIFNVFDTQFEYSTLESRNFKSFKAVIKEIIKY